MGEINITFNNVEFIMYPIHFMILELFDNIDKIKIKAERYGDRYYSAR
jgi:hypothetical protein